MSELKEETKSSTSNLQVPPVTTLSRPYSGRDTKITTTKQKDPKKVEAGRRLGQISKQIREQKMRAKIEAENKTNWEINYNYLIGAGGLILAAISVYYARAEHIKKSSEPEQAPETCRSTLDHL